MPTQREINALNKKITQLSDQNARHESRIKGLEKDLVDARKRTDHYRGLAAQNEAGRNEAELKLKQSQTKLRNDEPIGKGAFEVVTVKDGQTLLGRKRPAGTLLGFFTCIEGLEPQMVVDSIRYGTGKIQEADQHELFTELMSRAEQTEQLAAAEIKIAELQKQVEELTPDEPEGDEEPEETGDKK